MDGIRLHIFDMDGTLLDSMRMWEDLPRLFLRSNGIEPEEGLSGIVDEYTFMEAINYIADRYELGSPEETLKRLEVYVTDLYRNDLVLFEGITEDLDRIAAEGIPMVVLTNSWHELADLAFERTGIKHCFDAIYSYQDIGVTKDDPESFRIVCRNHGVRPEEALVHDDSDYALEAAKKAGCRVKVYDRYR